MCSLAAWDDVQAEGPAGRPGHGPACSDLFRPHPASTPLQTLTRPPWLAARRRPSSQWQRRSDFECACLRHCPCPEDVHFPASPLFAPFLSCCSCCVHQTASLCTLQHKGGSFHASAGARAAALWDGRPRTTRSLPGRTTTWGTRAGGGGGRGLDGLAGGGIHARSATPVLHSMQERIMVAPASPLHPTPAPPTHNSPAQACRGVPCRCFSPGLPPQ